MSDKNKCPVIIVAIGEESVTYHLRKTQAPKDYDGFGTVTVYEYDGGPNHKADSFRLVLIREEHINWQVPRYNSGRYYATEPEDWEYAEAVKLLWQRLNGVQP